MVCGCIREGPGQEVSGSTPVYDLPEDMIWHADLGTCRKKAVRVSSFSNLFPGLQRVCDLQVSFSATIMEIMHVQFKFILNIFRYNDQIKTPISKATTLIPIIYSCEKTNALTSILSLGLTLSGVLGSVKAV